MWSGTDRGKKAAAAAASEDVAGVELNHVKKSQSFKNGKLLVNEEDRADVKRAKKEGALYELLLDRRAKMKSDRYCK